MNLNSSIAQKVQYLQKIFCIVVALLFLTPAIAQVYTGREVQVYSGRDVQGYITSANSYFQQGDWDAGKGVVDEGLRKHPKNSDLRMLLGKYYFEKRNYDAARFELLKSLEYNPNNINAKEILVNVELASGRYSSAICYINELLETNPYWKGLWRKKIEIYRMQGNFAESTRLLKRLCQIYPEDEELRSAYAYYVEIDIASKRDEGKYTEALQMAEELADANPTNENMQLELINAYIKAGDYANALQRADKALQSLPNSTKIILKKTDILASLNRYDEALGFLQSKMKGTGSNSALSRRYAYLQEESARYARTSDPYFVYNKIFQKDPKNQEAFVYIFNSAFNRGMYEEALDIVKKAKEAQGETKDLLLKEKMVYDRMGNKSKAEQLNQRLYLMSPDDADVKEEYTLYHLRQAQAYMQEQSYDKAIDHWTFVADHGGPDISKVALNSLYACYYNIGKYDEAIEVTNRLIQAYPLEWEGFAKRSEAYGKQKKYQEAMNEYRHIVQLVPLTDLHRALNGCDEAGTIYTKQLIEEQRIEEALKLVELWLEINPTSRLGLGYAISLSIQTSNYSAAKQYCEQCLQYNPGDTYAYIKLAEVYSAQKKHKDAVYVLRPEVRTHPYHKELVGVHSQSSEDYARDLIKEKDYQESINVLDTALRYQPNNKSLKYWKGVAYEKMKDYDSAQYYQKNYEPSLLELSDFEQKLRYLQNRGYKNELGFYYLRSWIEGGTPISIGTIEYMRMEKNNTYGARFSYTGRPDGRGLQLELEWDHNWCSTMYTRITGALANKYFPRLSLAASAYKSFGEGHEIELGLGYRRILDPTLNMFNFVAGYSKTWENFWFNTRLNNVLMKGKYYYNLSAQMKHFLYHPKSYVSVMGSFGSAPDVEIIEYQLYNAFAARNVMLGGGFYYLITKQCGTGILFNWYNYEIADNSYQNLYTLNLQLNVYF